jgi:hypothetical protein
MISLTRKVKDDGVLASGDAQIRLRNQGDHLLAPLLGNLRHLGSRDRENLLSLFSVEEGHAVELDGLAHISMTFSTSNSWPRDVTVWIPFQRLHTPFLPPKTE